MTQRPDKIFPKGSGSDRVLARIASIIQMPTLLKRSSTGKWGLVGGFGHKFPLDNNGYVQLGMPTMGIFSFHLRKPDNISESKLYNHPNVLMNMLLKTGFVKRPVGSARIKVISLGEPVLKKTYTDRWQRQWKEMVWPLPFLNAELIVLALPVPDGYTGLIQFTPAALQYAELRTNEAVLDFFNVAYGGTLTQWKEYLQQTSLLPSVLKHIDIKAVYGQSFRYTSPLLSFSFTPAIQKITADSKLILGFGFFRSKGKVTWGVGDVYISKNINDGDDYINIERHAKPSPDLGSNFKSHWDKIAHQQHPFDNVPRIDNDVTKITGVMVSPHKQPSVLYTAFYAREGKQPHKLMKSRLDLLMKHIKVTEYETTTDAGEKVHPNQPEP